MPGKEHLAIIGSGPSAIYLLKHLLDEIGTLRHRLGEVSIFERSRVTGTGMPYSPETTDVYNLSNISSEELPELTEPFADWLRCRDRPFLESVGVSDARISESEIYSRLALGQYLRAQYLDLLAGLSAAGVRVSEYPGRAIMDIEDVPARHRVRLRDGDGELLCFDRVIIATGHQWPPKDDPARGYFASPWPIAKLLPKTGEFHNFTIGTLGASLSAFDVISSLAHRHGEFREAAGGMVYHPYPGADGFRIIMHSAEGLLPHLQYDQAEPFRRIYRHTDRESLLALVDNDGFLRLGTYFDRVCRPTLAEAFRKDGREELAGRLLDPGFGLLDFVREMTEEHKYHDAFEGMRREMREARESVLHHRPVHWKETVDDLFYTLNYHAELMPAEDHVTLKSAVMPFLLNVVAAMPLPSGAMLLALHDAGRLDMAPGKVSLTDPREDSEVTTVEVEEAESGGRRPMVYRMFVDCAGQKPMELEDYPFPGLAERGSVREARAVFADPEAGPGALPEEKRSLLFVEDGVLCYPTGGVDVDGAYRVIGRNGKPNPRIHDIAFPHTSGVRPYSYGLQACGDTGAILAKAWAREILTGTSGGEDMESISRIYDEVRVEDSAG